MTCEEIFPNWHTARIMLTQYLRGLGDWVERFGVGYYPRKCSSKDEAKDIAAANDYEGDVRPPGNGLP